MSISTPDINTVRQALCSGLLDAAPIAAYRELLADTAAWLDPAEASVPARPRLRLRSASTRILWEKSGGSLAGIVAIDCAAANENAIRNVCDSVQPPPGERIVFQHFDFSEVRRRSPPAPSRRRSPGWPSSTPSIGPTSRAAGPLMPTIDFCPKSGGPSSRAGDSFLGQHSEPGMAENRLVRRTGLLHLAGAAGSLPQRHRMLRYGKWLKSEASRGRFHYLPRETIADKLARAGFVRIGHRHSFAGQAYLFRRVQSGLTGHVPNSITHFSAISHLDGAESFRGGRQ